jgi:predicted DNA repair protein MutK
MKPSSIFLILTIVACALGFWVGRWLIIPILVFGGFYLLIIIAEAIPKFIKDKQNEIR